MLKICVFANLNSIHTKRWIEFFLLQGHSVYAIKFHEEKPPEGYSEMISGGNFRIITVPSEKYYKPPLDKIIKILNKISLGKFSVILKIQFLYHIKRKYQFDIVHGHYLVQTSYWAVRMNHHPCSVSAWGSDIIAVKVGSKENDSLRKIFNKTDIVQTGDNAGKERLIELGCPPDKIYINSWGVDTAKFCPKSFLEQNNKSYNRIIDERIILTINSLKPAYDIPTLIRSASILMKKMSNIKFIIVGSGPDRENLQNLIKKLSLENNVFLHDPVPYSEIPDIYKNADVYIETLPGQIGGAGLGMSLLEAMSSGLPIIAAKRPGIEYGVKEGINGFLFEPGNAEELSKNIENILNEDNLRSQFGVKSREIALQIGDWNKNMGDFEKLYYNLIQKYQ